MEHSSSITARGLNGQELVADISARTSHAIRMMALAVSCVSMFAALLAVYWFVRMRRQFRHVLIMLLVVVDLLRNLNYMGFTAFVMSYGPVTSTSPYCQASGFTIQFAQEAGDFTILCIVVHMTLQVFRPSLGGSSDEGGLSSYKKSLLSLLVCIPALNASLAFIYSGDSYQVQGPFCVLPIRPFWYRLALSWIPRYIIAVAIVVMTLLIHFRVKAQTNEIAELNKRGELPSLHDEGHILSLEANDEDESAWRNASAAEDGAMTGAPSDRSPHSKHEGAPEMSMGSIAENGLSATNHSSDPTQSALRPSPSVSETSGSYASVASSTAGLLPETQAASDPHNAPRHTPSNLHPAASKEGNEHVNFAADPAPPQHARKQPSRLHSLSSILLPTRSSLASDGGSGSAAASVPQPRHSTLKQRHRHIQRQMRLLMIYPIVYLLIWLCPFIFHCTQYSDYYAKHPSLALVVLTNLSYTASGAINALIFCLRERPWTRIPYSDGTLLGTFNLSKLLAAGREGAGQKLSRWSK